MDIFISTLSNRVVRSMKRNTLLSSFKHLNKYFFIHRHNSFILFQIKVCIDFLCTLDSVSVFELYFTVFYFYYIQAKKKKIFCGNNFSHYHFLFPSLSFFKPTISKYININVLHLVFSLLLNTWLHYS